LVTVPLPLVPATSTTLVPGAGSDSASSNARARSRPGLTPKRCRANSQSRAGVGPFSPSTRLMSLPRPCSCGFVAGADQLGPGVVPGLVMVPDQPRDTWVTGDLEDLDRPVGGVMTFGLPRAGQAAETRLGGDRWSRQQVSDHPVDDVGAAAGLAHIVQERRPQHLLRHLVTA